MRATRLLPAASLAALAALGLAQKKPLDPSVYDGWKSIRGTVLSRDGKWLAYVVAPQEGDATGTLRAVGDGHTITIPRASAIAFSRAGKWALATVVPGFEEVRKARREKVPEIDQPKNALDLVDLSSGAITTIDRVTSFSLPREDSGWFAYRLEPAKPTPPPLAKPAEEKKPDDQARGRRGGGAPGAPTGATPASRGATMVLRQLATGKEARIEFVDAFAWDKKGLVFAYSTVADKEGKGSVVEARDLSFDKKTTLASGVDKAKYPKVAINDDGTLAAFTTDRDDLKAKKPALTLYVTRSKEAKPTLGPIPNPGDSVTRAGRSASRPAARG